MTKDAAADESLSSTSDRRIFSAVAVIATTIQPPASRYQIGLMASVKRADAGSRAARNCAASVPAKTTARHDPHALPVCGDDAAAIQITTRATEAEARALLREIQRVEEAIRASGLSVPSIKQFDELGLTALLVPEPTE